MPNPPFDSDLLYRIEDAGLNASAPPQQRWLDGWLLRFSPGKAKRARCINAVAPSRISIGRKLELCEPVFEQAGLPLIVRITPMTVPETLDQTLARDGLRRFDDTRVMLMPNLQLQPPGHLPSGLSCHAVGLEPFAQRIGALRGSPLAQRQAHGQRLTHSPVPFHAYELHVDGQAVCCGQFAIEGDIVGLYDIFTAPAARGRGYALRLCTHLLTMAHKLGGCHAYLQVEGDNLAAQAVYRRLGFSEAYRYHYRTRNPSVA